MIEKSSKSTFLSKRLIISLNCSSFSKLLRQRWHGEDQTLRNFTIKAVGYCHYVMGTKASQRIRKGLKPSDIQSSHCNRLCYSTVLLLLSSHITYCLFCAHFYLRKVKKEMGNIFRDASCLDIPNIRELGDMLTNYNCAEHRHSEIHS